MKYKVIKPCVDQDTKKKLDPGDSWSPSSEFEMGRHLAEGNIVPIDDRVIERAVNEPQETRKKRGRQKRVKHDIETTDAGNG